MVFKVSILIFCFFHLSWTNADYISFGVGQSVCRQHEEFLNSGTGTFLPAAKTPPADVENQCLWYQMDKNCISGKETDCVTAKTCQDLGISGSGAKSGRKTKTSNKASGAAVYRVKTTDKTGVMALLSLEDKFLVDFYSAPKIDGFADVQVLNKDAQEIIEMFKANKLEYEIKIPDVQTYFEEERKTRMERRESRRKKPGKGEMTWDEFYNLTEIYDWLEKLTTDHSDLASLETIGTTYEEREIKLVKICKGGCAKKPTVVIEAGIHAREWAGITAATYILNELVTTSYHYGEILDKLNIYILPVLNPDGFDFAYSEFRNWRKNRTPLPEGSAECDPNAEPGYGIGVDLNRNFGYKWARGESIPCADAYPGESAFSEKETSAYRDFILKEQKSGVKFVSYFALHSYGQYWILPWAVTEDIPADYEQLKEAAEASVAALTKVHGSEYNITRASGLYGITFPGSSLDWFYGDVDEGGAGVKWSCTMELRSEEAMFELPPEQILPNAEEVWAGIQVTYKFVSEDK